MEYIIENDYLRISVSTLGAEITSVINKQTGNEQWWNGDPAFWAGHAPILFPACGGLWNGEYRYEGKTYKMPKHGFVKNMEWQMVKHEDGMIALNVRDNEETRAAYPFSFSLTIYFRLIEETLLCHATVENLSQQTMHYQLGGHPALALPDYAPNKEVIGYLSPISLQFGEEEKLSVVRAGEQGCWAPERFVPETDANGLIPISVKTFANEALIYDHNQVQEVSIYRADGKTLRATVCLYSPVCLVWQMTDLLCPYVCIEPWYGLCDRIGVTADLDNRPYTQSILPGQKQTRHLYDVVFEEVNLI